MRAGGRTRRSRSASGAARQPAEAQANVTNVEAASQQQSRSMPEQPALNQQHTAATLFNDLERSVGSLSFTAPPLATQVVVAGRPVLDQTAARANAVWGAPSPAQPASSQSASQGRRPRMTPRGRSSGRGSGAAPTKF
jgi:hypothetical protein